MSLDRALEIVTVTHPGMVRSHNEDAVVADAARGFAVLADGMGGYNAGEVASGIAVNLISEGLRAGLDAGGRGQMDMGALLREQAVKANGVIYHTAQSQPQCAGMGTTLVMALFHDNRIFTAHVGDSRLYRLRGEELAQITRDHSLLQDQIDSGMITPEAARLSHNRNLVTRALGVDPQVDVALGEHEVRPGDIYLLCSDGLNDMVEDEDIRLTLTVMGPNLPLAAEQLIQMANDNGGRDNISVILVKVVQGFAAPRSAWSRLLSWLGL
jgi:protein phosphatase